jgi:hypothetical protein
MKRSRRERRGSPASDGSGGHGKGRGEKRNVACASWESVAVESITRTDATRIHSQIFDSPNPAQLIANGHSLFALLPKPILPTPDFQTHPPIVPEAILPKATAAAARH